MINVCEILIGLPLLFGRLAKGVCHKITSLSIASGALSKASLFKLLLLLAVLLPNSARGGSVKISGGLRSVTIHGKIVSSSETPYTIGLGQNSGSSQSLKLDGQVTLWESASYLKRNKNHVEKDLWRVEIYGKGDDIEIDGTELLSEVVVYGSIRSLNIKNTRNLQRVTVKEAWSDLSKLTVEGNKDLKHLELPSGFDVIRFKSNPNLLSLYMNVTVSAGDLSNSEALDMQLARLLWKLPDYSGSAKKATVYLHFHYVNMSRSEEIAIHDRGFSSFVGRYFKGKGWTLGLPLILTSTTRITFPR